MLTQAAIRVFRNRARACTWLLASALQCACAPGAFDGLSGGSRPDPGGISEEDAESSSEDPVGRSEGGFSDAATRDGEREAGGPRDSASPAQSDSDAGQPQPPDAAAPRDAGGAAGDAMDGALSDSGSGQAPDSAVQDSGPPGQSRCYDSLAARLMCEGFEAKQLAAPWNRVEESGAVSQSGTPTPHVGSGLLSAQVTASGGHAFAHRPVFPSLTSGRIFLRSYLYVASGAPLAGVIVHGLSEESAPYGGVSVLLEDTGFQLDVHPRGPGVNPIFIRSQPPVLVTRDRWHCIQLELNIHATMGAATLRVNGAIAAQSTQPLATLPMTGYRGVSAGIVYSDPAQAVPLQVYVDEFVADTQSIPCDDAATKPASAREPR